MFILSAHLTSTSSGFTLLFLNLILVFGYSYPFILNTFLDSVNLLLSFSVFYDLSLPLLGASLLQAECAPPSLTQVPRSQSYDAVSR